MFTARYGLISLDNKFQIFFCICDEYVVNLFICVYEVRNGALKNYLTLVLKLRYITIFYEIGCNIIRNGGLNKNLILFSGKECV